jgi:hypothetical protein
MHFKNLISRYFSEKISPAVHDLAAKKAGFGAWKELMIQNWVRDKLNVQFQKNRELESQIESLYKRLYTMTSAH